MDEYRHLKIKMDKAMHERLQEVAKRNRRDVHSHVLYLIDKELSGYILTEAEELAQ